MNMKYDVFSRLKDVGLERVVYYHIWRPIWVWVYYLLFKHFYGHLGKNVYVSPRASILWKNKIYLGDGCNINSGAIINVADLTVGKNFSLGFNSCILGSVTIGDDVMVGPNVSIVGGNHEFKLNGVPMNMQPCSWSGIAIMNDVWIGANSVILDKSVIENHCVIAASSVVREIVKSRSISGGNPLRLIKYRN